MRHLLAPSWSALARRFGPSSVTRPSGRWGASLLERLEWEHRALRADVGLYHDRDEGELEAIIRRAGPRRWWERL
jgi:hypothetical protein